MQVRARTQAGYGSFSPPTIFRTLPDGKRRSCFLLKKSHTHTHIILFFLFKRIISNGGVTDIYPWIINPCTVSFMNLSSASLLTLFNNLNSCPPPPPFFTTYVNLLSWLLSLCCSNSLTFCLLFSCLSLLFAVSPRTWLWLRVLGTWHLYRCRDAAACHFRLCGRLLHTVRTGEREIGTGKQDRFASERSSRNNRKWSEKDRNQKPITNVTPILQFCTALFFCLYKSYLINGGFALCYPHLFFFFFPLCEAVQTQSKAHDFFCLHS